MGCGAQSGTPGTDVFVPQGRFVRKQVIGAGSYGTVYQCEDSASRDRYAMKVVKIGARSREQAAREIELLKTEISLLKRLNHQNIVKYEGFEVNSSLEQVEIVMELVRPGSLRQHIDENGPLSEIMAIRMGSAILRTLVYLHAENIIHRDLKCANILITDKMEPKISDFGTAKIILNKDIDDIAKISSSLKGTPFFMAPQVINRTGHNHKADIWSFGCLMIEMLTANTPWKTSNLKFSQIIAAISSGKHPPFPTKVSKQCRFFLQSCLDAAPANRLDAHELLKHRFIDRAAAERSASEKKPALLKTQSKTIKPSFNLQSKEQESKQSSLVLRQSKNRRTKTQTGHKKQKQTYESEQYTSVKTKKTSDRPVRKHTERYTNQINRLNLLQTEIHQVSFSQQQVMPDKYFIKKTLANLKEKKYGQKISRTSTTIKNSEAMQQDQPQITQYRTKTEIYHNEEAIDSMIARAERNQLLQHQKFMQKQREEERKKWQQQLRNGAQMLKKELSSRYIYTGV